MTRVFSANYESASLGGSGSKSLEGDSVRLFFFMSNTDWKFFENYIPDNNIFSGKQYRAL